jgi:protein SCO1
MKERAMILFYCLGIVSAVSGLTPDDLSRVKFEQHPGRQISVGLLFRNENGHPLKLGELLAERPVILVLGYYRCPMLCTMINDGLINALENLQINVGADFNIVALSIDPTESPAVAAERKKIYLRRYGRPGAANGWHCLVGDQRSIAQIADEVGFRYAYDPETRQYAHPSGVIVLTPGGKISRYVFGISFNVTELRDAIATAKEGKSSSVLSQIFLLCYHYNPITGKYGTLILSILRVASLGFVGLLGWWIYAIARPSNKAGAETG